MVFVCLPLCFAGSHSIGVVHCKFFVDRLYNFQGTNRPDPSLDPGFLELMRSKCNNSHRTAPPESQISFNSPLQFPFDGSPSPSSSSSLSPSSEELGIAMDYDGRGSNFGTLYYQSLLQGRGILYADQQLMAKEGTESWVRAYASENTLFRRDFAMTMMKLSNLQVLTAPMGLVRFNCSKVGWQGEKVLHSLLQPISWWFFLYFFAHTDLKCTNTWIVSVVSLSF